MDADRKVEMMMAVFKDILRRRVAAGEPTELAAAYAERTVKGMRDPFLIRAYERVSFAEKVSAHLESKKGEAI
jgi:hypothetical protein